MEEDINKEFLTEEEIEKLRYEKSSEQIDELYKDMSEDAYKRNKRYKEEKYSLYYDAIKDVYGNKYYDAINGKEWMSTEQKELELIRSAARKTAFLFLSEINYNTTPEISEHFRKLSSIIATD